jgi:hypothetical protein
LNSIVMVLAALAKTLMKLVALPQAWSSTASFPASSKPTSCAASCRAVHRQRVQPEVGAQ